MSADTPHAARTLAIVLGASAYPHDPALDNPRFAASAQALKRYLLAPDGGALAEHQLAWLFDADLPTDALNRAVRDFLAAQVAAVQPRDVLVFCIGHGFLLERQKYYLALRHHEPDAPEMSYAFQTLQRTVKREAPNTRRYFVIDACFSGAALREMMGVNPAAESIVRQAEQEARGDLPQHGTALLCAASATSTAAAPEAEAHTMFTGALLRVLEGGAATAGRLSLRQLGDAASIDIQRRFGENAVRPELSTPDQREGRIDELPLFAVRQPGAGAAAAPVFAPPGAWQDSAVLRALVVGPAPADDGTTPLQVHLQTAWEQSGVAIAEAADAWRRTLRLPALPTARDDGGFSSARLPVEQVFASEASLQAAIGALAQAEVAVFDLTGFDPVTLFLLGVRAVARRGVTVCSVGGDFTLGGELAVPFNLQLLNLSAHSQAQDRAGAGQRPAELLAGKIASGLRELAALPHYLDLPAYDAIRALGVSSDAYRPVPCSERVLALCPFGADYTERNWRSHLESRLPGKLQQRLVRRGLAGERPPRLQRLLDLHTPRLIAQTLFEAIRRVDLCIVDWTGLRDNVVFEAGVRLAAHPLGAVHVVEHDAAGRPQLGARGAAPHVQQMLRWLDLLPYRCRADEGQDYAAMVDRYLARLEGARAPAGREFVYRALGAALEPATQGAALPLADELVRSANLLSSDDQQSTGVTPVLFADVNPTLAAQAAEAAAERRLAAWLFLAHRWSADEIAADEARAAQFRLLAAQVRRWAAERARQDLVRQVDAALAGLQPAAPGAATRLPELQARLKLYREQARAASKAQHADEATALLEQALAEADAHPQALRLASATEAGSDAVALAQELADCLGMLGNQYLAAQRFEDAQRCFERGSALERAPALGLCSSYNLVGAITAPLQSGRRRLAEVQAEAAAAVGALERQLQGARRDDLWAWADLGKLLLLMPARQAEALAAHRRVRELDLSGARASVDKGLQRLAEDLAGTEPEAVERIAQARALLAG